MSEKIATKKRELKNFIYNNTNTMYKHNLSNLTKDELINLLLKQNKKITSQRNAITSVLVS